MKKFFYIIFILLFLSTSAFAQFWQQTDQATVACDDDNSYPDGVTVTYSWLLRDPAGQSSVSIVTSVTSALITIPLKSYYYVGVKIQVSDTASGALLSESAIAWSDDPVATNNNPFGLANFKINLPGFLRKQ